MASSWAWLHPYLALGIPALLSLPLGWWMFRALDIPDDQAGRGIDAAPLFLARLISRRAPRRSTWSEYAVAFLSFNLAIFLVAFALLAAQPLLPLNPDGKGALSADLIFNTVCSFVTNTNLQHYSGEQSLSYFNQLGCVMWLQFVTPAAGLAAMLATIRGLRGDRHMGDFALDLVRSLLWVFIPLSLVVAVALVAQGIPMTFSGAAKATTLEGAEQTIARGPAAAVVAIKQLGTNGGGFFGPNSAHPYENPTPFANLIEEVSLTILPMSSIVMLGLMLKNRRHAALIFGVMFLLAALGVGFAIAAESHANAAAHGLPIADAANMEGKEVRIGSSASWSALTTATSNGSVNAMHDSMNPLGGLVPLAMMMLNVAFSGIGAGFENMLIYIIVAVFLAGLMVGRTPEYLGKKVEAREVKFAMIALLLHPLLICAGSALFAATALGKGTTANPGAHGFTEILYEFTSSAANNGSGFEGLADNNPAWNLATGFVLLLGRFPAIILPLAIAGSLAAKGKAPETTGTLRTDTLTFAGMLLGTIALVGALSFLPAIVLGPVADALEPIPAERTLNAEKGARP